MASLEIGHLFDHLVVLLEVQAAGLVDVHIGQPQARFGHVQLVHERIVVVAEIAFLRRFRPWLAAGLFSPRPNFIPVFLNASAHRHQVVRVEVDVVDLGVKHPDQEPHGLVRVGAHLFGVAHQQVVADR